MGKYLVEDRQRSESKGKTKRQVSGFFLPFTFHSRPLCLSLPLHTVNGWTSVSSPGRYRVKWTAARCVLPGEAEFLLLISGESNNAVISGESSVPFVCPECPAGNPKECSLPWGWEARAGGAQHQPKQTHAKTRTNRQRTLPKSDVGLQNGIMALLFNALKFW